MNRQLMYDDLVLGEFIPDEKGQITFIQDPGIKDEWLPFEIQGWKSCPPGSPLAPHLRVFMEERVIPPNRYGIRRILQMAGLKKYNLYKLGDKLRYSNNQQWWIAIEDTDSYRQLTVRGASGEGTCAVHLGIPEEDRGKYRWRP